MKDITPSDVIAELVAICTVPSPPNPFAVDFDYFESLPMQERFLASGAMLSFLNNVLCSRTHSYDRRSKFNHVFYIMLLLFFLPFLVRMDLQRISDIHFRSLLLLCDEGILSTTARTIGDVPPPSPLRKYPNLS